MPTLQRPGAEDRFLARVAVACRRTACVALATLACVPGVASAGVVFESATLAEPGSGSGFNFTSLLLGVRFELTGATRITAVGGHLAGSTANGAPDDTVFGAIVALSGPGDFPDSADLSSADVLGHTLLPLPNTNHSNDFSATLDLLLGPGLYGLVFGGSTSGLFGASGDGYMTTTNPIVSPQDFFARNAGGTYFDFSTQPHRSLRFFVEGVSVPEPWTALLLATWLAAGRLRARRCSRAFTGRG